MWAIANYRNVYDPDEDEDGNAVQTVDFPVDANGRQIDYELFDQKDNSLTPEQFQQQTGLDPFNLMSLSDAQARYKEPIYQAQRDYQDRKNQTYRGIKLAVKRDPVIEKNLLAMDDPDYSLEYVSKLASRKIDLSDLPEKILTSAASKESRTESILKYFPNAPEKIQQLSIDKQRTAIKDMIEAGVIPSTNLLLKIRPAVIAFGIDAIKELNDRDLITPELKKHLITDDYAIGAMLNQGIDFTPKEIEGILTTPPNPKGWGSVADYFLAVKFITRYGIWPSDAAIKNIALSQTYYDSNSKTRVLYFNSPDEVEAKIVEKLLEVVNDHESRIQKSLSSIDQWQEQKDIQMQKADETEKEIGNSVFGNYRKKEDLAMYQRSAALYQSWIDDAMQNVKELSDTNAKINAVLRKHKKI